MIIVQTQRLLIRHMGAADADFIMESIVDPSAEIAPGFQDGVMPTNYGEMFTDPQLEGLVDYLLNATGGGAP